MKMGWTADLLPAIGSIIIFDATGVEVPEFAFTIGLGIGIAVMISSLILRRA